MRELTSRDTCNNESRDIEESNHRRDPRTARSDSADSGHFTAPKSLVPDSSPSGDDKISSYASANRQGTIRSVNDVIRSNERPSGSSVLSFHACKDVLDSEKYLSTASDKAADNEVREIFLPTLSPLIPANELKKPEETQNKHPRCKAQSRRSKQLHQVAETINSRAYDVSSEEYADLAPHQKKSLLGWQGVSSNDTNRRSSNSRFDHVISASASDHPSTSSTPPHRKTLRGLETPDSMLLEEEADHLPEETDEIEGLISHLPQPSIIESSSTHIQGTSTRPHPSSYLGRTSNSYKSANGNGLPRIGSNVSSSSSPVNPSLSASGSFYNQSPHGEQYDPVITTTIKPTYEVDAMWSFKKGPVNDRSRTAFNPNIPTATVPPNTTSRYESNQTAYTAGAGLSRSFTNANQRTGVSRQPRGSSRRLHKWAESSGRCKASWKLMAIILTLICVLLLALLLAFLSGIIQSTSDTNGSNKACQQSNASHPEDERRTKSSADDGALSQALKIDLQLDQAFQACCPPAIFTHMQFYVSNAANFKFNFTFPVQTDAAVYGRKGLRPTHTKYESIKRIDASTMPRSIFLKQHQPTNVGSNQLKSGDSVVQAIFSKYLQAGTWYWSVYNGGNENLQFQIKTSIIEPLIGCPDGCSGNGDCDQQKCSCYPGWHGDSCEQTFCAIPCQGNGVYNQGRCSCYLGWKGAECSVPSNKCTVPDCNGKGECDLNGECVCEAGYKGDDCSEVDCTDPTCSENGKCIEGKCYCQRGWTGSLCSIPDESCSLKCSDHGTYDEATNKCKCDYGWKDSDCSIDDRGGESSSTALCSPGCDPGKGVCVDGTCRCQRGWKGPACQDRDCHPRCAEHGSCMRDGTCVCQLGWNGEICTFEGCPNECSYHGVCTINHLKVSYCSCKRGWKGISCEIETEMLCGDARDNDKDGLSDCSDPDCCSQTSCSGSSFCLGAPDPVQVVRKLRSYNPLHPTASFYDRVKFLISQNGIQEKVETNFDENKVSILRGKVLGFDGFPLTGVTVKVKGHPEIGSTRTRSDGWYDLLVEGGPSQTLIFTRTSFRDERKTTAIGWNQFVILPTVTMHTSADRVRRSLNQSASCNWKLEVPAPKILINNVRSWTDESCSDRGSIVPEIQAIRKEINLPTSGVSLVYLSSRVEGFVSMLQISLIENKKPDNLQLIHLMVDVEGSRYETKLEAVNALLYTFKWNQTDAYSQRVYGVVPVQVWIGYQFQFCEKIYWQKLMTSLKGEDPTLTSSPFSAWSLNIHHTYLPSQGRVYLGGGGEMSVKEQSPMIETVIGDGENRDELCSKYCEGPGTDVRLLFPYTLANDGLGNLYIGDHNFIRKLDPFGSVSSLYSTADRVEKYYIAASSSGEVYFTLPVERRIYKLRYTTFSQYQRHQRHGNTASNYEIFAGTGHKCLPMQKDQCGNGQLAKNAKLTAPKGIAVDLYGRVYFVDGNRIRTIEPLTNIIGNFAGSSYAFGTRPLPCSGSASIDQLELNYPTSLAYSPVEEALYVLDGDVIIKIDIYLQQVSIAAGVPVQCLRKASRISDSRDARMVPLVYPTAIAVSPLDGALYIAESDGSKLHQIRRIDAFSGRSSTIAGSESSCDCAFRGCNCYEGDGDFARNARLHGPSALTVMPDGTLFVADQSNARIRKIYHSAPKLTNQQYRVSNPDKNHLYVFDKEGLHLQTRNIITDAIIYDFITEEGSRRLQSVKDSYNNRLRFDYKFGTKDEARISLPGSNSLDVQLNEEDMITKISDSETKATIMSSIYSRGGLLQSILGGSVFTSSFEYDVYGRLVKSISATGVTTTLYKTATSKDHTITLQTSVVSSSSTRASGRWDMVIQTEPGYICDIVTTTEGGMKTVYDRWTDNSMAVKYLDGSTVTIETKPHPILGHTTPFLAKRTAQLPADPLENKIEWRTRKEAELGGDASYIIGRRMRVNGRNVLSLDYSRKTKVEKIYDDHTQFTLRVQYNSQGYPVTWLPSRGLDSVNVSYNNVGKLRTWQHGNLRENFTYVGLKLQSSHFSDRSIWKYSYSDSGKVTHLETNGNIEHYLFEHDNDWNLKRVVLPSGLVYGIVRYLGIGFVRVQIDFNGRTLLEADESERGNLLAVFYPGEKRKTIYRYDIHNHVTEILYDGMRNEMTYDIESGELTSVATQTCSLRYSRNGPLVERQIINLESFTAHFEYVYDTHLRLIKVESTINGSELDAENYEYDDVSGKQTKFARYNLFDLDNNDYSVGSYTITKKAFDENGRVVEVSIDLVDDTLYNMILMYGNGKPLQQFSMQIGVYGNQTKTSYLYTPDGSLSEVTIDGRSTWKYRYGLNGQLTGVSKNGNFKLLNYDQLGRLTWFNETQYLYDNDGILRRIGNKIFEYDSLRRLTRAYHVDGLYDVEYKYDGFSRLTSRKDLQRNEVIRFVYSQINHPLRITHYYLSVSESLYILRYDREGFIFALELPERDQLWTIACDLVGTPVAVIDSSGRVTKQLSYSPFGEVLHESNKNFHFPFGFRGGVYDRDTGLVHFGDISLATPNPHPLVNQQTIRLSSNQMFFGVDYLPETGQTTTPYISWLMKDEIEAFPFKPYQLSNPTNQITPDYHMTKVTDWLEKLGFKLNNVVPDIQITSRQKDKSSTECQLTHHLSSYMNLDLSTPSSLASSLRHQVSATPSKTLISSLPSLHLLFTAESLFISGIILSIDKGFVRTRVADDARADVKRVANVINNSQILIGRHADTSPVVAHVRRDGSDCIFLFKNVTNFNRDVQALRLPQGGSKELFEGVVTSLQGNHVNIKTDHMILVIAYVSNGEVHVTSQGVNFVSLKEEVARTMADCNARSEQEAWNRELLKIKLEEKTRWNVYERKQILLRGRLDNYVVRSYWEPTQYPELIDSSRNVIFEKIGA